MKLESCSVPQGARDFSSKPDPLCQEVNTVMDKRKQKPQNFNSTETEHESAPRSKCLSASQLLQEEVLIRRGILIKEVELILKTYAMLYYTTVFLYG